MKYFTKEQINRLQEASHYFYTAVYENYKRGTMSPLNNLVAEVYAEATGEKLNPNWSCNSCCLNNFKTAGKLYFDSVKYWETHPDTVENAIEPALVFNELPEQVANSEPKPAPKKGGRPKGSKNKKK